MSHGRTPLHADMLDLDDIERNARMDRECADGRARSISAIKVLALIEAARESRQLREQLDKAMDRIAALEEQIALRNEQ